MLRFNRNTQLLGIRPELLIALISVDGYFRENDLDWYIVAAVDGAHAPSSAHYRGCAIRIDIAEADEEDFFGYAADLDDILPLDFSASAEVSYLTIEYNPRKGVNR